MGLFNNPIMNMKGPNFLIFYGIFTTVLLLVLWWRKRQLDTSASLAPLSVPKTPDPHLLAYLKGGENALIRLISFDLTQRGYIETDSEENTLSPANDHPGVHHLTTTEKRVFNAIEYEMSPGDLFSGDLPDQLTQDCRKYEEYGLEEQLLHTDKNRRKIAALRWMGYLLMTAVIGIRICKAINSPHTPSFSLLVLEWFVFSFIYKVALATPRLTKRGEAFFEQLETAFAGLQTHIETYDRERDSDALLLAVGIFGVAVLEGTVFAHYNTMFASSAGGCGAGCGGGCGSGCGGGCGGCGGCG